MRTFDSWRVGLAMGCLLVALGNRHGPGGPAWAGVGDPQVRTSHPWYPGELAISTWPRLFATQAEAYQRVVGHAPTTDEQRALAAWLWRSTHFAHGECGAERLMGPDASGSQPAMRDYWTGMFADGFALCGSTHAQWTAEINALLGHNRARSVGVTGHNAFEVWLTGGPYGDGRWVLVDHDLSTVVFSEDGARLLSIAEIMANRSQLADPNHKPEKQHGWPLAGQHPGDAQAYASFQTVEYLAGYAGPPPRVHLRRGETLRRYLQPGLEDGQTFVYWGRNYNSGGIPGPERPRSFVNQPERFYNNPSGAGFRRGQARYGNAVFTYRPNFADGSYREAVVAEDATQVTLEFVSPYTIAAAPVGDEAWAIYQPGCRNGLVVSGLGPVAVSLSVDRGETWTVPAPAGERLDLTDQAKGYRQYWLRLAAGAEQLRAARPTITTICQCNPATIPRLTDNGTEITYLASHQALASAGPTVAQAAAQQVAGALGSPTITLELAPPRGAAATAVYGVAHVASSNPPRDDITYHIDYSLDGGTTFRPLVDDWRITRRGDEPPDFWSQSFVWGDVALDEPHAGPVQVRFSNRGGKRYLRVEAHLAYRVAPADALRVTFHWTDAAGPQTASHQFAPSQAEQSWRLATGQDVETRWVEYAPVESR